MRSLIAIAALVALVSFNSNAAESVLRNKKGTVVGVYQCDESIGSCSISGDYLELDLNDSGLVVVYKASFPDFQQGVNLVYAYVKLWGDCIHVLTDFGDTTFYINRLNQVGASKPEVCGRDGFIM